jgi:hypothetical protein
MRNRLLLRPHSHASSGNTKLRAVRRANPFVWYCQYWDSIACIRIAPHPRHKKTPCWLTDCFQSSFLAKPALNQNVKPRFSDRTLHLVADGVLTWRRTYPRRSRSMALYYSSVLIPWNCLRLRAGFHRQCRDSNFGRHDLVRPPAQSSCLIAKGMMTEPR